MWSDLKVIIIIKKMGLFGNTFLTNLKCLSCLRKGTEIIADERMI